MSGIIIQGFLLSGLYALIAVGFTMIFSVGRVLNLAYGVYIMLGGYVYYVLAQELALPKIPSFLGAVLAGILFGVLVYLVLVRGLQDNPIAIEISTLILAVVMQSLIILIFSPAPRAMWPLIPGVAHLHGVSVSKNIFLAMIISWVVLGSLMVFVRKTQLGRAIRAVSMDKKGAVVSGIDPQKINVITWAISGALGAIAGVFFATYTQLDPAMWVFPLITAIAVVIVGGIGSIMGSLVAAHLVGFLETITTSVIAPELRGVFTLLLIIIILIIVPKGLFGREEI
ncbi:MAG: branched-chain amino acid ABC transporter permease [Desulfobacterales bacterium]|nr:branched-chain amino acid ABC transporter permease [Deltaproteobacteria bacterium]NNL78138.1 branched-chain amino acid ABC transporter permease [Desulfobacterales bacterium]